MRFYKFTPAVCILTFFIGYGIAPSQKVVITEVAIAREVAVAPAPEIAVEPAVPESEIFADIPNWKNWSEEKFKIELQETGEAYHGDQIDARTGEVWLGLFDNNDAYSLRSTKVKVRRAFDAVVDDEITNKWTGKSVFTDISAESVFLLKGAKQLTEGPVTTLYRAPADDEEPQTGDEDLSSIRAGFSKDFTIGKTTYTLTARAGKTKTGEAILALILESEGISQVIHSVPAFDDNYLGSLEWAGDLDRDEKPDFYFSLYVHDNVQYRNLYLTSSAKKGKLVKKVAMWFTNGC
jgi:hypothetical protein